MSLCEDMLIKILARLPSKSLHRFKLVSKEWYNLISKGTLSRKILPPFMLGLFYQNIQRSGYAFVQSNSKVANGVNMDRRSLSFLPCHQKIRIANCCNGLLLCWSKGSDSDQNLDFSQYIVCNPITKNWVSLPEVHRIDSLPMVHRIYRVASSIELEIFSSETGKWVESTVHLGCEGYFLREKQPVFSSGALHVVFYPHHVLKFDIKEERCRLIEFPEPVNRACCLGESGGCLLLANLTSIMKIWTLRDCQSSEWVLKYSIEIKTLLKQPSQPIPWINFSAFHPVLDVVFLEMKRDILSYHLKSSKLEKFNLDQNPSFRALYDYKSFLFPFSPCQDTFAN
ncbi:F-box protein At5g07610-like [Tasmannia lanceolata]|uniref:F-box protein At5g07610-like n=1 Tax=Tasmannia lanceolata TaxID=3420 RepID=UPI004063B68F